MLRRNITDRLTAALQDTPVVMISGPRQSGKSTLARMLPQMGFPAAYHSLDSAITRSAANRDPDGYIRSLERPVVIDEVQKAPDLFPAIKAAVDRDRKPGGFVLTGSANILLLPQVSESLTGRIEILTLWPFTYGELEGRLDSFIARVFDPEVKISPVGSPNRNDLAELLLRGGFPEAQHRHEPDRLEAWFEEYLGASIERDLRDLGSIEKVDSMAALIALVATRVRSPLNKASLSSTLALNHITVDKYLSLLERAYLLHRIPAFSSSIDRRVAKRPKLLVTDSGLLAVLRGFNKDMLVGSPSDLDDLLEGYVGMELVKQTTWNKPRTHLSHFSIAGGPEVDFVLGARDGRLVGIEVKAADSVFDSDFRHLRAFGQRVGDNFTCGIVLHTGNDVASFGDRLYALPIASLWS